MALPSLGLAVEPKFSCTVAPSSESITPLTPCLTTLRQNLSFLISASNLVFLTAIESADRAHSIPANGIFQNLVVVERAVAEGVVDSV